MEDPGNHLLRLQISLWLPARCAWCKKEYTSVDDFMERNPRAWGGGDDGWTADPDKGFIDDECYDIVTKKDHIPQQPWACA